MECKIDDLPDVLLEYILSLIPPYKDLQECKLVSKRWFRATKNVIQHSKSHFHKSVACGSLLWGTCPTTHRIPTIGKRHSHSACTYENSMYVFGGCTATSTTFNDLWRLDLDTRTWVRPITMGSYPSPKACASMLYYKKSFILFGGLSYLSAYPLHEQWELFNELHVYSIESNKWMAIDKLVKPPPTSAHSASIHKNCMVVFGGIRNDYISNDIWCLNLDTYNWETPVTSDVKPQPRYAHSQIELGDNHLLILGGCTGPNAAINDAWLLKMEGTTWTWVKVTLRNTESAPTRIWCRQACRVGNHVIVVSINKRQNKPNDTSIPSRKVTCQRTVPPRPCETVPLHERQRNVPNIDRDVNVNGRHGSFSRASLHTAHSSSHSPHLWKTLTICNDNMLGMHAFRDEPLRNGSNSNRQRQLESLRRMEERIKNRRTQSKTTKETGNTLSIYVLDITNVLCDECSASWIPLKYNNQIGPDEKIMYSLVAGRGELIVFGGIRKGTSKEQGHPDINEAEVYNDLHFISTPRYII